VSYSLKIKASVVKELKELPKTDRLRISQAIDSLQSNPHVGTLLKGNKTGLRRIGVGDYRVIYEVQNDVLIVLVLRVGHRREIYR
jgi:mRNA interferase RelE/StbE